MPAPSRSLRFEEAVALGLEGRRFTAREGPTFLRGCVRRAVVEEPLLIIDVDCVELRRGEELWRPSKPFTYRGRRDFISVSRDSDGAVFIDIPYIGSVEIEAPRMR